MTSVTVKKLSDDVLNKLNDKAKKNQLSQQEYLRRLIKMDVMSAEIEEVIQTHEELIKSCLVVIKENTEVVKRMIEVFGEE